MDNIEKFLQSPDVIRHYDLLSSLGILDRLSHCRSRIRNLEELLSKAVEIFNMDTTEDLVDYVISTIVDRFVPGYLQFTFRSHGRNETLMNICYENLQKADSPAPITSLEPFENFFYAYPGTISFTLFEYSVEDPDIAAMLKPLDPEIVVPIMGPHDFYGMFIIGKKVLQGEYSDEEVIYLDRLMHFMSISFQNSQHSHNNMTDFKTQLYNHSFFQRRLTEELAKVNRYGSTVSVMVLDIDYFKQLNDLYGHLAGDKVLFRIARILEKSLRREDVVARFGGEEFVILLPESTKESAFYVAERIRSEIAEAEVPYLDNILKTTVSIGVNYVDTVRLDTAESVLKQTNKALNVSKSEGRNRVTYHRPGLLFKVNHDFFGTSTVPAAQKKES